MALDVRPLTPETWDDLVELFSQPRAPREEYENDSMFFRAKSLYDRAGFDEVARRKPTRPVVRKERDQPW